MDKHIQAAAKALHKVNALPLDMASAAVRAWLASVGLQADWLDAIGAHAWAEAVRAVERATSGGVETN